MKATILFIVLLLCSLFSQGQNKSIDEYPIPKNIEQCFKVLDKTMTEREKYLIKTLPEDSIYFNKEFIYRADFFHEWKIYDGSRLTNYFNKKGLFESAAIYEIILISYHRYLNNKEIDLEGQIKGYNDKRQKESEEYQLRQDSILQQEPLNRMIISSINSYIAWSNDFVKRGISSSDTSNYYICMDGIPSNFPYNSVENVTFFSLHNTSGLSEPFRKKLEKGIWACFVWIKLINNRFEITVGGREVELMRKNHIGIGVGDSGVSTYEYSCEEQKWLLVNSEYGGV